MKRAILFAALAVFAAAEEAKVEPTRISAERLREFAEINARLKLVVAQVCADAEIKMVECAPDFARGIVTRRFIAPISPPKATEPTKESQ